MRVELELSESTLRTLAKWASVSRTFDNLINVLFEGQEFVDMGSDRGVALEEIEALQGPLDEVNAAIKEWSARNPGVLFPPKP